MAPNELKQDLYNQHVAEGQASFFNKIDVAFDAGVASVGSPGSGLTPELKALVVSAIHAVVDSHDANLATDIELKASLQSAVEAL